MRPPPPSPPRPQDSWRALPPAFNAQKSMRWHHPQLWEGLQSELAVLHFTGGCTRGELAQGGVGWRGSRACSFAF